MNTIQTLACNLEALLNCFSDEGLITDETQEAIMGFVNVHALYQALKREGRPAFVYETGQEETCNYQYRGLPLFQGNALRIFQDQNFVNEIGSARTYHLNEVWLLEDLTFAVVTCYAMMVPDERGPITSFYRINRGYDWPEECELDEQLFYDCLRAAAVDYFSDVHVPYYES